MDVGMVRVQRTRTTSTLPPTTKKHLDDEPACATLSLQQTHLILNHQLLSGSQ